MKRQLGKNLRRLAVTACAGVLAMCCVQTAFAENNTGLGDINGDPNALTDSNVFQLFSTGAGLELGQDGLDDQRWFADLDQFDGSAGYLRRLHDLR